MGRKEVPPVVEEVVAKEDTPIVKELKTLDDKYLALDREYERDVQALQQKFTLMQQPLLEKRASALQSISEDEPKTGTPALPGFWLKALKNHPGFDEVIEAWDAPVLEFLTDLTKEYLDTCDQDKGFKLNFHFAENPYFSHAVLVKEYHTEEENPYNKEINCVSIDATEIEWKTGKDVTVEKVVPKAKGGAKKQQKAKVEPRSSFFRQFFRKWELGMEFPEDVNIDPEDLEEDDDEEEVIQMLMGQDHEVGVAVRDQIIPFAVRWYTGEAAPERDEDEFEGAESEDDGEGKDEEESDEDEDSSPVARGTGAKAKAAGKPAPAEECKQQ